MPVMTVNAEECEEVPEEVIIMSEELGYEYGICPEILQAIAWRESRFDANADNKGCVGMMQIAPRWHQDRMARLGVTDLSNPYQSMKVAADYLSELHSQYQDIAISLMVYNGDSSYKEVIDGTGELSTYATDILELSAQLEADHGKCEY